MPPKKETPLVINKKLILHFDVSAVVFAPPAQIQTELHMVIAKHAWGKLQQKDQKSPIVWKLVAPTLTILKPQQATHTYYTYLEERYLKKQVPQNEAFEAAILNFLKPGNPGLKLKGEFDKASKMLFFPKAIHDFIKTELQNKQQGRDQVRKLYQILSEGKFQIIPSFFKLILNLKKQKREFALIFHGKKFPQQFVLEFSAFANGEHPLYNGKNNTPLSKLDGSKAGKNYIINNNGVYFANNQELVIGTKQRREGKEQLDKRYPGGQFQKFAGSGNVYVAIRQYLKQQCSFFVNDGSDHLTYTTDKIDFNTQDIFFLNKQNRVQAIDAVSGNPISIVEDYDVFSPSKLQLLKDMDYFIKAVEQASKLRVEQAERLQKGTKPVIEPNKQWNQLQKMDSVNYLNRTIVPLLMPALQVLDKERPKDPLIFLALYCLKNKERVRIPKPEQTSAEN